MTVVELDRDLAERLAAHPVLSKKLDINQADAMRFDFRQLIKPDMKMRIFGNSALQYLHAAHVPLIRVP